MPLLALPLALVGLVALPALAAIYVLRTRYKRRAVSSLMLWNAAALATGGGRKANRLQTPWALLLELLALLLLVLAATMPRWLATGQRAQVMVVLDNSWSMRAVDGDGRSARDRGTDAVDDELRGLGRYTAGFVLAGPEPVRLGVSARDAGGVQTALEAWTAAAKSADLPAAVALARETGGAGTRVVVVTDRAPDANGGLGRAANGGLGRAANGGLGRAVSGDAAPDAADPWKDVRWRAVGAPGDNAAVVRAVRSAGGAGRDAVMFEVARSAVPAGAARSVGVQIEAEVLGAGADDQDAWEIVARQRLALAPGATQRVWYDAEEARSTATDTAGRLLRVTVTMPGDVLAADDRAWLAPADDRPVRVGVEVADETLRAAVKPALRATGPTRPAASIGDAEFWVTAETIETAPPDVPAARRANPGRWAVRLLQPADGAPSQAFLGPFLLDDAHPLTADASLDGVVWSAVADTAQTNPWVRGADAVLASAGEVPLIAWFGGDAAEIRVNVDTARSTLLSSVAWPVLMSNAVRARAAARPGITPVNVPAGAVVALRAGAPEQTSDASADGPPAARVQWVAGLAAPADTGGAPNLELREGAGVWAPRRAGVYRVELPGVAPQTVVVHGWSAAESDLSAAQTAEAGELNADLLSRPEYRGLGWLLGLAALSLLATEAWVLRPGAGGGVA